MDMFAIKNESGKVVEAGFPNKEAAKARRNELGMVHIPVVKTLRGKDVELHGKVSGHTVTKGKDHPTYGKRYNK